MIHTVLHLCRRGHKTNLSSSPLQATVHAYLNARSALKRREELERSISVPLSELSYLSSIIQISVPATTDRPTEEASPPVRRSKDHLGHTRLCAHHHDHHLRIPKRSGSAALVSVCQDNHSIPLFLPSLDRRVICRTEK